MFCWLKYVVQRNEIYVLLTHSYDTKTSTQPPSNFSTQTSIPSPSHESRKSPIPLNVIPWTVSSVSAENPTSRIAGRRLQELPKIYCLPFSWEESMRIIIQLSLFSLVEVAWSSPTGCVGVLKEVSSWGSTPAAVSLVKAACVSQEIAEHCLTFKYFLGVV